MVRLVYIYSSAHLSVRRYTHQFFDYSVKQNERYFGTLWLFSDTYRSDLGKFYIKYASNLYVLIEIMDSYYVYVRLI